MKTIIFCVMIGACVMSATAQTDTTRIETPDSTQAAHQSDTVMTNIPEREETQQTSTTSAPETNTAPATTDTTSGGTTAESAENNRPHYLTIFEKAYNKIMESKFAEFIGTNHWGAFGGFGPANVHFERYDLYQHAVCNVRLGIVADHDMDMITEKLFVETGLELQRKGYQRFFDEHADSLHVTYKEKTNLYYLVIPTTASYRFEFRGFEFTPMIGPYYAFALGGRFRYKRETNDRGNYIEQKKKYSMFGDKTGTDRLYDTRRFDFGLRIAVGIQYFEGMRSSMGYDWGFVDIIKNDFRGDKYKSKNGVFYLSHTYFFH